MAPASLRMAGRSAGESGGVSSSSSPCSRALARALVAGAEVNAVGVMISGLKSSDSSSWSAEATIVAQAAGSVLPLR